MSDLYELRMSVYASLLAALMAVGAYLAVPIGPVPIVLQNMFVFLAPLLLGQATSLPRNEIYWHFPAYLQASSSLGTWRTTPASRSRRMPSMVDRSGTTGLRSSSQSTDRRHSGQAPS